MKNPQSELVWEGRVQVGDEPGVYSDASYAGLCIEFPVTLHAFSSANPKEDINFILEAEDVNVFAGYPGHSVTVFGYEPDLPSGPKWKQVTLLTNVLTANRLVLAVPALDKRRYVSVQVRADTSVAPGLYDDFVLRRLSLKSTTHYAAFGFQE